MGRYVFHVDVNSAFLSWSAVYRLREMGETDDLREIPSIIGGDEESRHGIVLAKSVPAKKYGIETAEPIAVARRKCPGLVVVPSDYHLYKRYSEDFMSILRKYSDQVVQYSIDEAWVVFDGYDEIYGDMVEFAYKLKDEIRDTLGFTVNIGVSDKFLLAKMAGDFSKPDKVHILFSDEIEEKMWPLPVGSMLYAGKSMVKAMRNLGILTIGDLAHANKQVIEKNLGKFGVTLWENANGEDMEMWSRDDYVQKGYGHSTTTAENTTTYKRAHEVLLGLSEAVGARLRKDNVRGSCISLSIRYSDFDHISRQRMVDNPVNDGVDICNVAMEMLKELWYEDRPIRQLGVRVTKVTDGDYYQMSLFDNMSVNLNDVDNGIDDGGFTESAINVFDIDADIDVAVKELERIRKKELADQSMDEINKKYGKGAIKRASQI